MGLGISNQRPKTRLSFLGLALGLSSPFPFMSSRSPRSRDRTPMTASRVASPIVHTQAEIYFIVGGLKEVIGPSERAVSGPRPIILYI